MPMVAPASASELYTLLPSPTNVSTRPSRPPRCSRSARRSASAWNGCSSSVRALKTGIRASDASSLTTE